MRQLPPEGYESPGTLLTIDETAQRLGVDVVTVENLLESSGLKTRSVEGEVRLPSSELQRLQALSHLNSSARSRR